MERLKNLKENILNCVQYEVSGNLKEVNTKELGEAIDMIKDLSKAIYYCSIVEAMEKDAKEKEHSEEYYKHMPNQKMNYYTPMYYATNTSNNSGRSSSGSNSNYRMYYTDDMMYYHMPEGMEYSDEMYDYREGRSPIVRRHYMESKELHQGKEKQMKELEEYIKELSEDIYEMVEDSSQEEKTMLSQKLTTLANKIK